MKTYQTFCANITAQLFNVIEKNGGLLTWQKNWDTQGCSLLPEGVNGLYHGANIISLLMTQASKGFVSNQWLTFNQVNKLGGQIKKGAKSHVVYFWKLITTKDNHNPKETADKKMPVFKCYNVFNREQTTLAPTHSPAPAFSENTLRQLLEKHNVTVSHFGNKPYYNPADDAIVLPRPTDFTTLANYYATLLHELMHWTGGAPDRVPRQCFADYNADTMARAEEELVAEIGSVLLATHFGLQGELENHAAYIQSWKQELGEKQIMQAATKAAKAFEWLIKTED